MNNPKISVITVVYKDPDGLERTINSVQEQVYNNLEHIIIDGGSGQKTIDIIDKYKQKIDYWVSEPDSGIYDAMNKGIKVSTGKWLNFMNAGDIFYSDDAIEKVFAEEEFDAFSDKSLIYGYKYQDGKAVYPISIDFLNKGVIMACHQSMFFNFEYVKGELFYDTRYPIYADYELVNRLYMKFPDTFKEMNIPISIFEGGGISSRPSKQKRIDKYTILYRHYGVWQLIKAILFRVLHNGK